MLAKCSWETRQTKKLMHRKSGCAGYRKIFNYGNLEENIVVVQCVKVYA